jgi:galactokinase
MEGNVPIAAGLSSSSALCVCAALTAFEANGGEEAGLGKEGFIERVITG